MSNNSKYNIDYLVSFDLESFSAKRKATRLKAEQMEKRSNHFRLVSISKKLASLIGVYLAAVWREFTYSAGIMFRKHKPDFIFTRTFFGHFLLLARLFYPVKIIREVHSEFKDESVVYFRDNRLMRKLSSLINFIDVSGLKKVDGIIFNNPDLEEYFVNTYKLSNVKTTSIYNASDAKMFYPENVDIVRQRLNMAHNQNDKILTFTGSIVEWHGVEQLIEVFKHLVQQHGENYYLYIVGFKDDPYHKKLKSDYQGVENLTFVERVPVNVARDYANASDVCMVTTAQMLVSQGSPTKMYDYIACGKPIISQKGVNGYGNVVDEHGLGCSVDFESPDEAAREIDEFFKKTDFKQLARHNREKAETELNWSTAIDKWIQFAESI